MKKLILILSILTGSLNAQITSSQFNYQTKNHNSLESVFNLLYEYNSNFYEKNIGGLDSANVWFEGLDSTNNAVNTTTAIVAVDNFGNIKRKSISSLNIPTNNNQLTNGAGYLTSQTTQTLVGSNGITISSAANSFTISNTKRLEKYSGTTNSSGEYTVTFSQSYSVAPNIQANIINGTDTQNIRITSITTTGFTVLVRNRTDAIGLLPTYSNVNGASVDVLILEK